MPLRDRPRLSCAAATLLLLLDMSTSHAWGLERLQRKFDLERGLPFSEVNSIAQDVPGFLWITAGGGLFRYDGVELRAWVTEPVRPYIKSVATGPAGEVLVREGPGDSGRLYDVSGDGIRLVEGPDANPLVISGLPIWDRQSNLWATTGDRVWIRSPAGAWRELPRARIDSERPRLFEVSEGGDAILCTEESIWRVGADLTATRLASTTGVQKALVRGDGSILVLAFGRGGGQVTEIKDGRQRELFNLPARPIDMVRQGRSLWVAYDSWLVALRPNEPAEILGPAEGIHGGGPLLIDQEGSLWVASFRGLLQYPAPDTAAWLGDRATRRLSLGPEGIWVDSWGGLALLRPQGASHRPEDVPHTGTSAICVGTDGTLWAGYAGHFLEHRAGRFIEHPQPELTSVNSCSPSADGRVWLFTNLGLTLAGGSSPSHGPALRAGPPGIALREARATVFEDGRGRLWVAADDQVCHADAPVVASGRPASWSCSRVNGAGTITSLAEASPGSLWAGTTIGGVYRLASEDHWEPMAGSRKLPTLLVRKLRPSPSGGVWILSYGTIVRAVERPGSELGWEIVESPAPWHGLMISDAEDILEEAAGDLWITTLAGVVHVAADVRRAAPPVPRVELVDALVDGKALSRRESIRLPYTRNRIELRFAALSYRDPAMLRYQVRLRRDAPWLDASSRPSFQFVDLPPGTYQPEVRASLDGSRWSEAPARLSFAVLPPFWRTWWFAAAVSTLVASAAYGIYHARVARLIALERVRTDIATDLHDDIGASLSRTAILAEVVRRDVLSVNPTAAARLDQIARSSREVVDGMADVVWSLDPHNDEFGELVARVRAFASTVLPASGVAFSVLGPSDAATLAAKVGAEPRRQAYLVIKEAISNVARHAEAKSASISLGLSAGAIDVVVSDDGRGFSVESAGASRAFGGNGLRNMRARASRNRGAFKVDSTPGRGTTIAFSVPIGAPRSGGNA
jgi:signal transduction histidine kinase/ligand-binding sensor domain-containing protein